MAVPNDFPTVQQVYQTGHYDLSTKIGCGRFIEDVAWALHQKNERWGHLKKPNSLGGLNRWNGHGVDVVCWREDAPGQTTAVDLVKAGESSSASIGWNPDAPRYQSSDWYAPTSGDSFVLPSHTCKLGCSFFWLVGAIHKARNGEALFYQKVDQNLIWVKETLKADYIRFFFSVYGIQAWNVIGADVRWPDWEQTVAEAMDRVIAHGLRLAPTLVGEGANVPNEGDRDWLVDRAAALLQPRLGSVELVEMWNEYPVTGGQIPWLQRMSERFIDRVGSGVRVAMDTPSVAMGGHEGDAIALLQREVTTMYRGYRANTMTPQWNRAEPNPLDMGPDGRSFIYSHEPRGPGASAGGDVSDWLPLVHDYIQTAIQSTLAYAGKYNGSGYLYHSKPGVWGGYCDPAFPQENVWTDLWSPPQANTIAAKLADIRAGKLPDPDEPEEPEMPIPAYDEGWIMDVVRKAIVDEYNKPRDNHPSGFPLDDGYAAWIARTEHDYCAGMTKDASLEKHRQECSDELDKRAAEG